MPAGTLEEGLGDYLATYAGLTALISTRVYWMREPQGITLPCLTFERIDTMRTHTHDTSGANTDLARPRFQFDAVAETYSSAKAITDQVRAALNGKSGTIGVTYTHTIQAALVDAEEPDYDAETETYTSRSEYLIWHVD